MEGDGVLMLNFGDMKDGLKRGSL